MRENLTVAAQDGAARDASAGQALALVGLDWAAEAMPAQLSMGQRKLVGVARALAAKPRLLCLDEPAAGPDTRQSAELGACLRGLADRGQSMLLIEHDMGLVLGICDRVVAGLLKARSWTRPVADGGAWQYQTRHVPRRPAYPLAVLARVQQGLRYRASVLVGAA